jgi:integrase/recombinase XerD
MDRQTALKKLKGYGNKIVLNLHPHMFRHGLAIYLLLKRGSDSGNSEKVRP